MDLSQSWVKEVRAGLRIWGYRPGSSLVFWERKCLSPSTGPDAHPLILIVREALDITRGLCYRVPHFLGLQAQTWPSGNSPGLMNERDIAGAGLENSIKQG